MSNEGRRVYVRMDDKRIDFNGHATYEVSSENADIAELEAQRMFIEGVEPGFSALSFSINGCEEDEE